MNPAAGYLGLLQHSDARSRQPVEFEPGDASTGVIDVDEVVLDQQLVIDPISIWRYHPRRQIEAPYGLLARLLQSHTELVVVH